MSGHPQAGKSKLSPKLLAGISVVLFFAVALSLRVCLPYDTVFGSDWIKLTGHDAYHYMRLVDNLVYNFPHQLSVDLYFIHPDGIPIRSIGFSNWLLASIIWVASLGSPTQHTIDAVSVYFPAVLGALTVIPVYFIGKELFGRWVGVLSAGLIAVLPGEFLGRSILGFTDQHVAETLFTTVTMLFLILAIKVARQRQLTFGPLKRGDWAALTKPLIYSLLAGIFLGIYILTWAGSLLFVFIIFVYFIIQFIIDHLKRKSTDYLCFVGVILSFVTVIISLLTSLSILYLASLLIALLIPLILSGISRLMASKEIKPIYYPLTLLGLGGIGLAVFYAIDPSLLKSMLAGFSIFTPRGVQLTTMEMRHLLTPLVPGGNFFHTPVWGNFNTSFFFSLISLVMLIYLVIKQDCAEKGLLVVWSLIVLAAALGQRRFAYYFAVNVALLTGYLSVLAYYPIRTMVDRLRGDRTYSLSWRILGLPDFDEAVAQPRRASARVERKRAERLERKKAKKLKREKGKMAREGEARPRPTSSLTSISLWIVVIVFLLVFFPNPQVVLNAEQAGMTGGEAWWRSSLIGTAIETASQASFAPSDAWCSSLSWLKENTPDPFGNPDLYYQLAENQRYPESAYGIVAWWDYGYWITRMGHRIPVANPSQATGAVGRVASFFTSQDEKSANEIIDELDSPYIIIDHETAISKFGGIAIWVGREPTEFSDVYYLPQEGKLTQVRLFYPEYYRSLCARLYFFDGKAVTPESTVVISYQEEMDQRGNLHKIITSAEEFGSYGEAEAYLLSQESGNYRIIGTNRLTSPVPLEALEHYRLIHSSDSSVTLAGGGSVPAVKIFEYTD